MGWTGKDPIEWSRETKARTRAVFRRSVELMADELTTTKANGGFLPHVTGTLMRSLRGSTSAMPPVSDDQNSAGIDVGALTAGLDADDSVYLGFTVVYARRVNYGFVDQDSLGREYNQRGQHFVEKAAANWPIIVQLAAEEVMNAVMSRNK